MTTLKTTSLHSKVVTPTEAQALCKKINKLLLEDISITHVLQGCKALTLQDALSLRISWRPTENNMIYQLEAESKQTQTRNTRCESYLQKHLNFNNLPLAVMDSLI